MSVTYTPTLQKVAVAQAEMPGMLKFSVRIGNWTYGQVCLYLEVHELNVCKSMSTCIFCRLHIFNLSVVLINNGAGKTI